MNISNLHIVPFKEEFAAYFYSLNVQWLEDFFYVEPYDVKILSNPKKYVIDTGGYIFFAQYNKEIVGVVSLINQKSFFELSKMAVSPKFRGLKIGKQLVIHCVNFARKKQWRNIILYSHRTLIPAINLYTKMGFKEVPLEKDVHYKRADIKMILEL